MKKEKVFRSRPARRFLLIFFSFSLTGIAMILLALHQISKTYGMLELIDSIPLFVAALLFALLLKMAFDCYGKELVITPQTVTFRFGGESTTFQWEELREIKVRKFRPFLFTINTSLFLGDGKSSFEIHDIAFPKFSLILEVVQIATESARKEGYRV